MCHDNVRDLANVPPPSTGKGKKAGFTVQGLVGLGFRVQGLGGLGFRGLGNVWHVRDLLGAWNHQVSLNIIRSHEALSW